MVTLTHRSVSLKTPYGTDVLLPSMMSGSERLSEPFGYELQALSEKGDLNADDILGKNITLSYQLPTGGGERFFNGVVIEFSQVGFRRRFHEYHLSIRPWYWLLTRTADCRVFQHKSVPDIFEEVVKHYGFTDYKLKLKGSYQKWDYCVQYRETDFNFLNRLLEQEGIYYFFEHAEGAHTMVLADDASAHSTIKGYDSVPFFPPEKSDAQRKRDHLTAWSFTKTVRTTAYATTDFDFEHPRQSLLSNESITRKHAQASFEVFDYPAELATFSSEESKRIAKLRIQELQAPYALMRGQGNAAGLATGARFKLQEYPRTDLNIEYLIIGTHLSLSSDDFDAGQAGAEVEFSLSLDAIDARTPFRPERHTPKPIVQGAQTAIVVGPSGEEIYTDKHGRVKVQFHWDRYGQSNENSSCWVRVAQVWAGKQWGAIHIPRIGQEVIVSFLEGDPDKPIITGRVYNGDSMPPYDLPANKTQSGIKSRSSKDGAAANFNEIRFEDKKGSEQLFIHAEKNHDIEVENDETHWVGHDRTRTVDNDETTHIKHDRTETVDNNESITIGENRTTSIGKDDQLTVGKNFVLEAADQVTIKTGSASIIMKKDGTITIKGKDITLDGSGKITVKASGDVAIKGSKVSQN